MDKIIATWAKEKGAVTPISEAEVLHVCRKKGCDTINVRNEMINLSNEMNILGILFTRNLLWNSHIRKPRD